MAFGRAAANISKSAGFFQSGQVNTALKVAAGLTVGAGIAAAGGKLATDASRATYDIAFNNPDIDKYTMGTNVNLVGDMFPIPKPSAPIAATGGAVGGALGGAAIGGAIGYGLGRLAHIPKLGAAVGATFGAVPGAAAGGLAGYVSGRVGHMRYVNPTTISDMNRNGRFNRPDVPGDIVLGLYNSRLG